jgi:hypothetical protein
LAWMPRGEMLLYADADEREARSEGFVQLRALSC